MQTQRFKSTLPSAKMDLVVEPSFGALKCKLVDTGTDHVAVFVTTSPKWLATTLAADMKRKGEPVIVCLTWTDTESGFNFHLARKDAESLLAQLKEKNHV